MYWGFGEKKEKKKKKEEDWQQMLAQSQSFSQKKSHTKKLTQLVNDRAEFGPKSAWIKSLSSFLYIKMLMSKPRTIKKQKGNI